MTRRGGTATTIDGDEMKRTTEKTILGGRIYGGKTFYANTIPLPTRVRRLALLEILSYNHVNVLLVIAAS